jgi:hypothetical protein
MESAERKREDAEETRRREEFIGINKLRDSTPDFLSQSASMLACNNESGCIER